MRSRAIAFLLAILGIAAGEGRLGADGGPLTVAPTDARSTADERQTFAVPPGFEVQLVASEPDIAKPVQMAFDARGRLWVTSSPHFSFTAPAGGAADKLFILSDIDPATGKAGHIQVFADDLDIPTGILPLPDCRSCLVACAGEIRKYTDIRNDSKADQREVKKEVLFSGFGFGDTRGMCNSFTLMPDGWVYACHGQGNTSRVKGNDGDEVELKAGCTFRFRPDGSRIEVYAHGPVNPFGMTVDPWLNLYTVDRQIAQLIRGAYYENLDGLNDGLGFAPNVTAKPPAEGALCGLAWYEADHFPPEYRGSMFFGNTSTNRIHRQRIVWRGATPVAIAEPDFLVSKDPWFRPLDVKLGPDGALYIADSYNKTIGLTRVGFDHPERNRGRGRIWRVVWHGKADAIRNPAPPFVDLTDEKVDELGKLVGHANLTVRLLATQEIMRRLDKFDLTVFEPATKAAFDNPAAAHLLPWIAFRAGTLDNPAAVNLLTGLGNQAKSPELGLAAFWLQSLTARRELSVEYCTVLPDWLKEAAGLKRRAQLPREEEEPMGKPPKTVIVDDDGTFKKRPPDTMGGPSLTSETLHILVNAAIAHPHRWLVEPLVQIVKDSPKEDTHLRFAAKIALRNCLRDDEKSWPPHDFPLKAYDPVYSEIVLSIPTYKAATFLLRQVLTDAVDDATLPSVVAHIITHKINWSDSEQSEFIDRLTRPKALKKTDALVALLRADAAHGKCLYRVSLSTIATRVESEFYEALPLMGAPNAQQTQRILALLRVVNVLPEDAIASFDRNRFLDTVTNFAKNDKLALELRVEAAVVVLRFKPLDGIALIRVLIKDPETYDTLRSYFVDIVAASQIREVRLDARDAMKDVPYRMAILLGVYLANSEDGAEDLLDAVKKGIAPARLLQEKEILARLRAAKPANLDKRIAELTRELKPLEVKTAELIRERAKKYPAAKTDVGLGAKVFDRHCVMCHRLAGRGRNIGPDLDGIGARGLERLLEDLLDPSRNVTQAYRTRVIVTTDGRTLTGLMIRVEGKDLIVVDGVGKEQRIPLADIESNRGTMLSLMPTNFGDTIPESDFFHLVAYLLEQKPPSKK